MRMFDEEAASRPRNRARRRGQNVSDTSARSAHVEAQREAVLARPPSATEGCPPDREELGRSSWALIHSMAAYYPKNPTDADKQAIRGFFNALQRLYPCRHCREQLVVDLARRPIRDGSREELVLWVCEQHNLVNEMLGKPPHPCNIEELDQRWRTGRRECWASVDTSTDATTAMESLGQADEDAEDR